MDLPALALFLEVDRLWFNAQVQSTGGGVEVVFVGGVLKWCILTPNPWDPPVFRA